MFLFTFHNICHESVTSVMIEYIFFTKTQFRATGWRWYASFWDIIWVPKYKITLVLLAIMSPIFRNVLKNRQLDVLWMEHLSCCIYHSIDSKWCMQLFKKKLHIKTVPYTTIILVTLFIWCIQNILHINLFGVLTMIITSVTLGFDHKNDSILASSMHKPISHNYFTVL